MDDAQPAHGADDADGAHSADDHMSTYNKIIVMLTVLTAVEFGVGYMVKPGGDTEPMLGFKLGLLVLCGMAAWKAVLVGKVFMHLKYDPRILGWMAVSPVILATPLVLFGLYDAMNGGSF
jgi:cytochrome c oxidase subunit IV